MNSIASTVFISEMIFLSIQVFCKVLVSNNKSSLRVEEDSKSIAGNILRLAIRLSNCSSILPVPLNSSNITSSILDPVSVKAVAMIESEPPFSMFLAAPKNLLGLCNALASKPPVSTLPELG